MISITFPDVVIAVFVGLFLIRGCVRGFFKETFSVVALGIAILLTLQFSDLARSNIAHLLDGSDRLDSIVKPVIFLGSWVIAAWFFRIMFGFLSIATPGLLSRLAGGVIGGAKGVFFVALGLMALELHTPAYLPAGGGHKLLPYLRGASAYIQGFDKAGFEQGLDAAREKLGEKLDSAKEGVGSMKKKLEGMTESEKEEGGEIETREMKR